MKFLYQLLNKFNKSEFLSFIALSTINLIFFSIGAFLFYFDYYQYYMWYHKLILFVILFMMTTLFSAVQLNAIDALAEKGYRWKESGRGDGFHAVFLSFIGYGILILFILLVATSPNDRDMRNEYLILHVIFPGFYSLYPIFTYLIGYNQYIEDNE